MAESFAATTETLIRSVGLRVTRQRVAVFDAVAGLPHASAATVLAGVAKRLPNVSHQAVYDCLADLTAAGLLRRIVVVDGGPALFETRTNDNHHHCVCRACGLAGFAKIDLRIVRGLAYYTGLVFEAFDRAGKLRAIAGGGRYDNLVAHLSDGAVALPAVGFAMGDVVLGELLKEIEAPRRLISVQSEKDMWIDAYVVIAKEEIRKKAMDVVQELRDANYRVSYPLKPEKVGPQFKIAGALGADVAIVVGDEWPRLAVKHLRSGEQSLVSREELLAHLAP